MFCIYNNDTIIVKSQFNDDINLINFDDNIVSLVFTNYDDITNIEKSINNKKHNDQHKFKHSKFNCKVDNLPHTLLNLFFGYYFNYTVDNLPPTLLNLSFGSHFNQLVNNLPPTLLNLTFGNNFNQ